MRKPHQWHVCLFLGGVALAMLLAGCGGDDEVYPIYDRDEIARYIREAPDERDLFRVDGLIADTPYRLPNDDGVYRDLVDSVVRGIDVQIAGPFDFGPPFGTTHEALATVDDVFYVRTLRLVGADTLKLFNERELRRYGYFLLLGDVNDPFIGWKLWGFNSLGEFDAPVSLRVTTLDGSTTLPADRTTYLHEPVAFDSFPYIRLDEIDTLKDNDSLVFMVSPRFNNLGYYHLISAEGDEGDFTKIMTRIDLLNWVDTIKTPANNPRLWNVIFMQTFRNPDPPGRSGQYNRGWCIPYRVPQ